MSTPTSSGTVVLDQAGSEVLGAEACSTLLAPGGVGHLGISRRGLPEVLPVNFNVDGDTLVIRSHRGAKLTAAGRREVVALQADGIEPDGRHAWSVLVQGFAIEVTNPDEVERLRSNTLRPPTPHVGGHFIRIEMEIVSGRRFKMGGSGT